MKLTLERARKALWTVGQPLTRRPRLEGATVSDLFVWRASEDWRTYFELVDVCGLFLERPEPQPRAASALFFDREGTLVREERLELAPHQRRTVELTPYTAACGSPYGTFCVFHGDPPPAVSEWGSFLAERGYVGYRYRDAPLCSYAHGNLDAIARGRDGAFELLGARSLRAREYRLQHELRGPASYELAVVNPSPHARRIDCHVFSTRGAAARAPLTAHVPPLGCHIFELAVEGVEPLRVVLESHLVMARPIVFRIQDRAADVFHG